MRPSFRALFVVFILATPAATLAQLINGRLVSSFSTWERFDTVGSSTRLLRAYQSILIDAAQASWSLHTHFQAAGTFENLNQLAEGGVDYRFYYVYGRLKEIGDMLDLSIGRQPFYAGVGHGTLDGGLANLRLAENRIRIIMYGGANVPDDFRLKGWGVLRENYTIGGQILTTALTEARFGVSYFNRRRERAPYWALRPDSLFNPLSTYVAPGAMSEEYLGFDASYQVSKFSAYARFDHDLPNKRPQRAQVGFRFGFRDDMVFSGELIHWAPRIPSNSFFAVFNPATVNEFELGIDHSVFRAAGVFVRGAYVAYLGEESFRYTAGFTSQYVGATYRGTTGYAGELNSFTIQGAYPFLDGMLVPSAVISHATYRSSSEDGRQNVFTIALGAVVRPLKIVSMDAQVQWLRNPVYGRDVRLFGKINYWFAERL
jgi:hypothetical protein